MSSHMIRQPHCIVRSPRNQQIREDAWSAKLVRDWQVEKQVPRGKIARKRKGPQVSDSSTGRFIQDSVPRGLQDRHGTDGPISSDKHREEDGSRQGPPAGRHRIGEGLEELPPDHGDVLPILGRFPRGRSANPLAPGHCVGKESPNARGFLRRPPLPLAGWCSPLLSLQQVRPTPPLLHAKDGSIIVRGAFCQRAIGTRVGLFFPRDGRSGRSREVPLHG